MAVSVSGGDPSAPVTVKCDPPGLRCENVPLRPVIVLRFDRIPAASSVARANYRLTSKATSGDLAFKRIRVDPVERAVIITFDGKLQGPATYELRVQAVESRADRLAAFDGVPFEGTAVITLNTTSTLTDFPEPSIDPLAETNVACAVIPKFRTTCASDKVPCHGVAVGDAGLQQSAAGLTLLSIESMEGTAIGKSSVQAQTAQSPGGSGGETRDFPYGLPLIDPGNSARSYLLYKILKDPRRDDTFGGAVPPVAHPTMQATDTAAAHARMAAELAGVVPGAPMPYSTLPNADAGEKEKPGYDFAAWSLDDVRRLRAWIDQGACGCNAPCPAANGGGDAAVPTGDATADSGAATDASVGN